MRIKSIVIVLFLASVFTHVSAEQKSEPNMQSSDETVSSYQVINYRIDIDYNPEGYLPSGISNVQLISNDSGALIRIKTEGQYSDNDYISVALNRNVSNLLECFLRDLYFRHKSAIKDKYINDGHLICPASCEWHIELTLKNGKRIDESFNLYDFLITFDDPFNFQFNKARELIYAIINKFERDILLLETTQSKTTEQFSKLFHDEYFEPYEDNQKK